MKKTFIIAVLCCLFSTAISAQIIKGDMNDDGKITMADATEVANTFLGSKAAQTLSVYQQEKVDEMFEEITNLLRSIDNRLAAIEETLGIEEPDGHEYVDLGLPSGTLWAKTNIGAEKETDYGDYFAWGETEGYNSGKTTFDWSTYKYCDGSSTTLTKYCNSSSYGTVDDKKVLDPVDDAATANWGSKWCMPTSDQIKELCNSSNTTTKEAYIDGTFGIKITSNKNGNYIFLPFAGMHIDSKLGNKDSYGYYWSRSLDTALYNYARVLCSGPSGISDNRGNRSNGYSVRAVRNSASK